MAANKFQSPIIKRSIKIGLRKTSVSLEDEFWAELKEIANSRSFTLQELLEAIREEYSGVNFSSALRVYVLNHFVDKAKRRPTD